MAPWERERKGHSNVQDLEENTHAITNNSTDSGIVCRKAFRFLQICGAQILRKANGTIILEPGALEESVPATREKGSWNLNRRLTKNVNKKWYEEIYTCHKQYGVDA